MKDMSTFDTIRIEKICAALTGHRFRKRLPCIGVRYSVCRFCGKLIREEVHQRS
jgi:hypothetical protein